MSHFTVTVVGDNVEEQLQPFHEFECTGVDDRHVKEVDVLAETIEHGLDWRGLTAADSEESVDRAGKHKYGYAIIKHGRIVKAVKRTNPNKKWDWWRIGGRWTGFYVLKAGARGVRGDPGTGAKRAPSGTADQCRKGDIDVEAMISRQRHQLTTAWHKSLTADPRHRNFMYGVADDDTLESYIERGMRISPLQTLAILNNGEWVERGTMGWFGCVSNEKSHELWGEEFRRLFDALPDDALLTIVDCHI